MTHGLCDADGIATAAVVISKGEYQLALCAHHYRRHYPKFDTEGWVILEGNSENFSPLTTVVG